MGSIVDVEEVPQNMHHIPSTEENITMIVPQKITIYAFSATLGHNGIFIIIFFKPPSLECIFSTTWSLYILSSFYECPGICEWQQLCLRENNIVWLLNNRKKKYLKNSIYTVFFTFNKC